jgi:CRISPR system Cascade subunit CasC
MDTSLFLQLHALRSHSGVLLNRNDIGEPKTLTLGGVERTRVSSQCRKYHWRHYDGTNAISKAGEMAIRSRETLRQKIAEPLAENGLDEDDIVVAVHMIKNMINGETNKSGITGDAADAFESDTPFAYTNSDGDSAIDFGQVIILGRKEVEYLRDLTKDLAEAIDETDPDSGKDAVDAGYSALRDLGSAQQVGKNLKALRNSAGIDAAMHGRMVTSDILSQADAAVHVAHAFTTTKHAQDSDYFAATDDLTTGSGSGHINQKELTSGVFYEYAVVDIPLLVSNLEACERDDWQEQDLSLTTEVLRRFVRTCAEVAPGAKQGSTAPHSLASFVLAEVGPEQPCSLAEAFVSPVTAEDAVTASIEAIGNKLSGIDQMYDRDTRRAFASEKDVVLDGAEQYSLPDLARWVTNQITQPVEA